MADTGAGYQTGNPTETTDEAGAVSNRLSLSPNDEPWSAVIAAWKDGGRYKLSDLGDVDIIQISAGEFEVVPGEPRDEGASDKTDETPPEEAPAQAGYPNPAIANLPVDRLMASGARR